MPVRTGFRGLIHRAALIGLPCLIAAVLLSACGDEPPPAATPLPADTPTATPVAAATPEPTAAPAPTSTPRPTATPRPSPVPADVTPEQAGVSVDLDFDLDEATLWGELLDLLTAAERACVRGELGDELLKSVRKQPVTPGEKAHGWEASVFGCLAPEKATDLFLSFVLANMDELTEENEDCLRGLVANVDVVGLIAASMPDADPASAGRLLGFSTSLLACMPVGPLPGGGESAVPVPSAESLLWHHHTGGWIVYSPTVADGVVYFGSDDNHVYALDAVTGDLLWRFETGGVIRSSPTVTDGAVHVGSNDNHVYALAASTGELLWKHDTGDWVQYSPAVSGGTVYLAALAGGGRRVHALDAATGEPLWVAEMPVPFNPELAPAVVGDKVYAPGGFGEFHALDASTGELVWTLDTGIPVESPPTVVGGTVYLTAVNTAYALDEATGEIVWEYGTERLPARDVPAVVADGVYYFSPDNHIYALNAGTGEPVWSWSSESDGLIDITPVAAEGIVYVGFESGMFYALDTTTGELLWSRGGALDSPTVVDGVLYAESEVGHLQALDAESGEPIWSFQKGYFSGIRSFTVTGSVVYVGSLDGGVYAFTAPEAP